MFRGKTVILIFQDVCDHFSVVPIHRRCHGISHVKAVTSLIINIMISY